ncbi:hypothetical protein [uncultured Enterovirga sp.]|uniref:hypothetical protein n=1 Tax=uncultured Enterovirga sp. TaxID=2026352 RepID=UPI0035CB564F
MRIPIGLALAAALAAASAAAPALADAPPERAYRRPHVAPFAIPRPEWTGPRRMRHGHRHPGFAVAAAGPVYGREPRYYPGMGGASPNAGFGAVSPVAVVGYREPYIGRGLVYNVPPEPTWAVGWSRRSNVVSVKY